MSKPRLSAKEIVQDLRSGVIDAALMEKYNLSAEGLQSVFKKLISAGVLQQAELDSRAPAHKPATTAVWKCPACGKPQSKEFEECPDCGVIVSRFVKKQKNENKRLILPSGTPGDLVQGSYKEATSTQPVDSLSPSSENYSREHPYYRQKFMEFDANGGKFKPTWNWAALCLGCIWYFMRGIWPKGLLIGLIGISTVILVATFSGEVLTYTAALPVVLYWPIFGNYDYYLYKVKKTQGYGHGW